MKINVPELIKIYENGFFDVPIKEMTDLTKSQVSMLVCLVKLYWKSDKTLISNRVLKKEIGYNKKTTRKCLIILDAHKLITFESTEKGYLIGWGLRSNRKRQGG